MRSLLPLRLLTSFKVNCLPYYHRRVISTKTTKAGIILTLLIYFFLTKITE
jgi:hypothetical protein